MGKLTSIGNNFNPIVTVSWKAMKKMEMYVDIAEKEVGWYGLVEKRGPCEYYVLDVFMLKQEVNAATTEIDPNDLGELCNKLWSDKVITMENQDNIGLYMWGHSHVNMSPTPSGQDEDQFKKLFLKGRPPFFIRLIMNKRGEKTVALYIGDIPILGSLRFEDVTMIAERPPEEQALYDEISAEMKDKVKDKKKVYSRQVTPVGRKYTDNDYDDYYSYYFGEDKGLFGKDPFDDEDIDGVPRPARWGDFVSEGREKITGNSGKKAGGNKKCTPDKVAPVGVITNKRGRVSPPKGV